MKKNNMESDDVVLLIDEVQISPDERDNRIGLGRLIAETFPSKVLTNLSVLQPAIGCLNRCSFCSQESGVLMRMIDGKSIRTIAGALRYTLKTLEIPFLTCQKSYKPGVIFPYLDNDIGSYMYLPDYLVAMASLGVRVRTSTIGWSRKNSSLNEMHSYIVRNCRHMLAGVRFSLTSYSAGWVSNREEFLLDFINSIRTYRPLMGLKDEDGNEGACIDVDFKPEVIPCKVELYSTRGMDVIRGKNYYVISKAGTHSEEAWLMIETNDTPDVLRCLNDFCNSGVCESKVIHGKLNHLKNEDGSYYGFYPDLSRDITDGIFFFPKSQRRNGGILNACWPLREFEDYIKSSGEQMATYDDAIRLCLKFVSGNALDLERNEHLAKTFVPMFKGLCRVLDALEFPPCSLFDRKVIRDRGIIRNSGRAFYEFRNIVSCPNIMVVPEPLLCSSEYDLVWRIFPTMIFDATQNDAVIGKKSRVVLDVEDGKGEKTQLWLVAWEVDAPSHSHNKTDGSFRSEWVVPLSDFVNPMLVYDLKSGKDEYLMPGI